MQWWVGRDWLTSGAETGDVSPYPGSASDLSWTQLLHRTSKASVLCEVPLVSGTTSIQLKRNRRWVDFNFVGWSLLGSLWGRRWWREGEAGAAGVWTIIYVKKAHHNEKLFLDKCWWSKMRRPSVFRWQLKAFPFYSWAVYISVECL